MTLHDTQALLPQVAHSQVPPFESLVVQSDPHLKAFLIYRLHEEFATFLIDVPLDVTQTCI